VNYRRTITIFSAAIITLLALLLGLGLRQYTLNSHHQEVVRQAEKLTFQFAMIREFILEVLLSGQTGKLPGATQELEELSLQASQLLQASDHLQHAIDFKRSFDPSSLILLLKGMTDNAPAAQTQRLNRELRDLGERFQLLDRSLVQQSRQQLVFLQYIIIGILALVTSGLFLLLLRLYRRTFAPLVSLAEQCARAESDGSAAISLHWLDPTLDYLASCLRGCHQQLAQEEQARQSQQRALKAVHLVRGQLGYPGGREKILQNCCRNLLDNQDYCLAWIGLADPAGADVVPVSADASTSMTRDECASCMTVLLTAAEESGLEFNPAARALQEGQAVLQDNILANTPKGLLKNTPLADGQAVCAAFPLRWQGKNIGVLSLYAKNASAFGTSELELFMGLADSIAMTLQLLDLQEELTKTRGFLTHVLNTSDEFLAILTEDGLITEAGATLRRLSCAGNPDELTGRHWSVCFRPSEPGERVHALLDGTAEGKPREVQLLALTSIGNDQRWRCRLLPLAGQLAANTHYALWGQPQQCATLDTSLAEQECASMLPILGRITASTAHDIRDLASGIINYAQLGQDSSPQTMEIFGKILKAGERVADVARALVFYGQQEDAVEEFLPVNSVLSDTIKLLSSMCHNEHIRLDISQQEDLSRCHLPARPLQQMLCTLLLRGRRALNSRYPGADGRKRLHIQARHLWDAGEDLLEITVTDWGVTVGSSDLQPTQTDGGPSREHTSALAVSRCRQLAQAIGGQLRVSEQPNSTSMILTLPIQHSQDRQLQAASHDIACD